ncbi:LVIVD repeat-containing protein [Muriicola sp. Z0-33]|uniref:LVIVD repeat-containing protein n=1 Tax=Muriicola sp. Z0-33 TaxID=2816957 RepID=UPI0022375024|nr:hypothetical protein [Muriicola sp. Z0-33]MCW5515176.1 hypothetical protein [Muriicola sp. Z0-33]
MKKQFLLILVSVAIGLTSCEKTDDSKYADYLVARPLKMSMEEFKNSVDIISPVPIDESGKIYAYQDYIFVNDKYKGVHVIDNSDPSSPKKVSFIKIAGNVDISVKDNYLYADSLTDLIVLNISDVNNIEIVNRLDDVLYDNVIWPAEADIFEFDGIDYQNEILIGWEVVTERRLIEEVNTRFDDLALAEVANDAGNVGQGGSLARFKIVDDYLYAVDSHNINVFEISDLENPKDLDDVFAGFDIETIFNRGEHLFLGSMRGMYIYDISSPASPSFVSEFQHGTACDPVVVDGDYAYVTLRGGNNCGATESGLFIVDISDISNPVLAVSYPLDGPYGLGIKDEKLFVCDGDSGLKIFDKTDIENLETLNHFEDIVTFDVIPREEMLLMVGDDILYQYEYLEEGISLMSTLELN